MTSKNFSTAELKKCIVFEDAHLLVIDKPAGLLSQGAEEGLVNLVDLLRVYLDRPYVGLVHRLDRNTSGLMVVAKRSKSAERLTTSLQEGLLIRKYRALVHGRIAKDQELHWHHWLTKDEKQNKVRVYRAKTKDSKEAKLKLRSLGFQKFGQGEISLIELELETGRSHQIRAQAAFEDFPLLGDYKYGAPQSKFPRTALHSYFLKFPHPKAGEGEKTFLSPLPPDFKTAFKLAD